MALLVGASVVNRANSQVGGNTIISGSGTCSANGVITRFSVWPAVNMTGIVIGMFDNVSGDYYIASSADTETIGNATAGSEQIFTGLNLTAFAGDYLGIYFDGGYLEVSDSGGADVQLADNWCGYTTVDHEFESYGWECSIGGIGVTAPTVTTQAVTTIQLSSATGNGNVTDTGGAISERGICWNTTGTPTTSDYKAHDATSATGAFTESMTGMKAGVKYYVRAYCINEVGTAYGSEVNFTTYYSGIMIF